MITRINKRELYTKLLYELIESENYESCQILKEKLENIDPFEEILLDEDDDGNYIFLDKNQIN